MLITSVLSSAYCCFLLFGLWVRWVPERLRGVRDCGRLGTPRLVQGEELGAGVDPCVASPGGCKKQGELPKDVGEGKGCLVFGRDLRGAVGCRSSQCWG